MIGLKLIRIDPFWTLTPDVIVSAVWSRLQVLVAVIWGAVL